MKIEDIKVGMNVRRTRGHTLRSIPAPKGYTFTVKEVNGATAVCDQGWDHDIRCLEPTDLETQLIALQAEVERIKAAIRDRDMPKVGDVITWGGKSVDFKVFARDDEYLALVEHSTRPSRSRLWLPLSALDNLTIR